jgi:hypothetical protein
VIRYASIGLMLPVEAATSSGRLDSSRDFAAAEAPQGRRAAQTLMRHTSVEVGRTEGVTR